MTRIPQKGYSYASKEAALSQRQAEMSPSDTDNDSDEPTRSVTTPGKQLRIPPPSAVSKDSSASDDSDDSYASLSSDDSDDEEETPKPVPQYPIRGARARKRVRPPPNYSKQMAVYIRLCLLNLRGTDKIELHEDEHLAFQKALQNHTVERVVIPDSPPAEKTSSDDKSPEDSNENSKKPKKKAKKEKQHDSPSKASKSTASEAPKPAETPVKSKEKAKKPIEAEKPAKAEKKDKPQSSATTAKPTTSTTTSAPPAAVSNSSTSSVSAASPPPSAAQRVEPASTESKTNGAQVKRALPSTSPPAASVNVIPESVEPPAKRRKTFFQIPANADPNDMERVRQEATKLQNEGIALKHDGDKQGRENVAAQGVSYLRASAKFLRQALLLSDLKAMCKSRHDSAGASRWGKDSISTLSQTAALIESTVGLFNKAGEKRRVALSYKFIAIVLLTSYRLQHNMLYGYYSQLHAPGRSPDGNLGASSSNQDPIRSLILKEMGAMMRGFEFWRRFEGCGIPDVLPHVQDPSVVDISMFYADLEEELSK